VTFGSWNLDSFGSLTLEPLAARLRAAFLFGRRPRTFFIFDILSLESRLVYSRLRIAITELFLYEKSQSVSW
jgi:hypothetical protein